jgi:hypothetical protein
MKQASLLIICLLAFQLSHAQRRSIGSEPKGSKRLEVIAGPTYSRFDSRHIYPAVNYHLGILGALKLRRSYLQAGLEYLPISANYQGWGGDDRFANHVLGASIISALLMPKTPALSLDLGSFYGISVYQSDNYTPPPQGPDMLPVWTVPIRNKTQFQLRAGLSLRTSERLTVRLSNSLGSPTENFDGLYVTYYMLQGSLGYRL